MKLVINSIKRRWILILVLSRNKSQSDAFLSIKNYFLSQCFLKINIETAYAILRELSIPEENIKSIYFDLINP